MAAQNECKTLWMGAIQAHWDEAFLYSLFAGTREVVRVKIFRNMTSNRAPLGYAFIDFETHEAARRVLETYNGCTIPGHNVVFRLNWGAGGRQQNSASEEYSLFVGDLSPEVSDAMLEAVFARNFPSCCNAKVITDSQTGQSKGYGFVRFKDKNESEMAMAMMNGAYVGSRTIRVSKATDKKPGIGSGTPSSSSSFSSSPSSSSSFPRTPTGSPPPTIHGPAPAFVGVTGHPTPIPATAPYSSFIYSPAMMVQHPSHPMYSGQAIAIAQPPAPYHHPPSHSHHHHPVAREQVHANEDETTTTVFVGNLDPSVDETKLREHFSDCGTVTSVKIPMGRGCGFVRFMDREMAERAIASKHGTQLGSSKIRLDWGKPNVSSRPPEISTPPIGSSPHQPIFYTWPGMPPLHHPHSPNHSNPTRLYYSPPQQQVATAPPGYFPPYQSPPTSPLGTGGGPGLAHPGPMPGGYGHPIYFSNPLPTQASPPPQATPPPPPPLEDNGGKVIEEENQDGDEETNSQEEDQEDDLPQPEEELAGELPSSNHVEENRVNREIKKDIKSNQPKKRNSDLTQYRSTSITPAG